MDIIALLSPDRISCNQEITSKKRAFERLAQLLSRGQEQISSDDIFEALMNREKLGCTALGSGVAIPHARLPIAHPRAAILSLTNGVDLDAPDKKAVTVLIGILMPEEVSEGDSQMLFELTGLLSKKSFIKNLCCYQEPSVIIDYFNSFCNKDLIAA